MKRLIATSGLFMLISPYMFGQNEWHKSAGIDKLSTNTFMDFANVCFAGTVDSGVYMSPDHGLSWTAANSGIPFTGPLKSATDFAESDTVLYASFGHALGGGISSSSDGGISWELTDFPTGATDIIATDSILCASTGSYFFIFGRSADWGDTWTTSSFPFSDYMFNYKKANDSLFATSLSQGLVCSADYGLTWNSIGFAGTFCFDYLVRPDLVIVSTEEGINSSEDRGTTWQDVDTTGLQGDAGRIRTFAWSENIVFAASDTAIYFSALEGTVLSSWTKIPNNGLPPLDTVRIIGPIYYTKGILLLGTCDLSAAGTGSREKGMGIWYNPKPVTSDTPPEPGHNAILIYPNPAGSYMVMILPETMGVTEIILRNSLGKPVLSKVIREGNCRIEVAHLPRGIYMVEAKSETTHAAQILVLY